MEEREKREMDVSKERYDHRRQEQHWQEWWEEREIFRFNPLDFRPLFTIDTPPPTISGRLHLGHAFSYTQAEVIVAYKRMAGYNVRYPFGIDNNGLPTEKLVEKEIKLRPSSEEQFIRACYQVIGDYQPLYEDFFRKIGFRWDLNLEYSTISPEVQRISQQAFLELFGKGIIYRSEAPALFCTSCQTSVAQAEIDDKEFAGAFYDLAFKKADGSELIISTSRPELLPACVAIFVHPQDKKYADIVGSEVETPLEKKVRVLADEKVSPEKGTGVVMCCTYGDTTDVYWGKTYNLPEKAVLDTEGRFISGSDIPQGLEGKGVEEGRKILVRQLEKRGFVKRKADITHTIGVHERCGTPIEIIPTAQWFVKILEMKSQLLAAADQINWYPPFMKKRYIAWVEGLKWDWCISRGRFFGIPIPAFICQDCQEITLPKPEELPVDPRFDKARRICFHCQSNKIQPEKAVFDTWFTSALTPDINNSHHLNGPLRGKMYPMSLRPIGHDIIRSWTTYTILMGLLLHQGEVPWRNLMVSGHILAKEGEKISKKTGGGKYDPLQLVRDYSADALRYVMCGGALGRDVYFDEKELRKGQRLVTKIFNAGRFVLLNLREFDPTMETTLDTLEPFDRWCLLRMQETAAMMGRELEKCEFGKSRQIFEEFFWSDFCDNYLEIVKGRVYGENENLRLSAQYTLYHAYLGILKMAAPLLPHISEEMYHSYYAITPQGLSLNSKDEEEGYFSKSVGYASIHLTQWPSFSSQVPQIDKAIREGAKLSLSLLGEIRKSWTEVKKQSAKPFSRILVVCDLKKENLLRPFLDDIQNFAKAGEIGFTDHPPAKVSSDALLISL